MMVLPSSHGIKTSYCFLVLGGFLILFLRQDLIFKILICFFIFESKFHYVT